MTCEPYPWDIKLQDILTIQQKPKTNNHRKETLEISTLLQIRVLRITKQN